MRSMRSMEFAGRMCLTAAGSLAVATANAQTTPASAGTTLYQEARAASAAGNHSLAQRKSEAACRLGSADACSLAATWYNGGSPAMTVNAVKALPLYIRACELENEQSSACEEAGKLLSGGSHGITRDNLRARTYFKRACDLSGSFGRGCEQSRHWSEARAERIMRRSRDLTTCGPAKAIKQPAA